MKIIKKNFFTVIILFTFLTSCGTWESVKRGLTNQKEKSTDEFLVKKKDPLIFPPEYEKLPSPEEYELAQETEEIEYQKLILKDTESSIEGGTSEGSSAESSILKKIQKN